MSQYYQQVKSLLTLFSSKYLHPHLDEIILSYIIYESVDFHEWIIDNWATGGSIEYRLERDKITIWKINANYATYEYLLNSEEYPIKRLTNAKINISAIKQLFSVWWGNQGESSRICLCVSIDYSLLLFSEKVGEVNEESKEISKELKQINETKAISKELFGLMVFFDSNVEIILGETIEQVYAHEIPSGTDRRIENSKIRIIDSNDYGFSSIDFNDLTFLLPYTLHPFCEKLYYNKDNSYGEIDLSPLCDGLYYFKLRLGKRDKEYNFIIRLKDGRWLSYHTRYETDIHYDLISVIRKVCGMDGFLSYQNNFDLDNCMKKLKKIKLNLEE